MVRLHSFVMLGFLVLIGLSLEWRWLPLAFFYGMGGMWLIRELSSRDPEFVRVYLRGRQEPLVRGPG